MGWVQGPSKAWGPGPQGLGAQAPSGLLAGYYAKVKKELLTLSVTETIQHAPPRLAEGLGLAMTSRITGANTGQWVRLFNDLARNQKKTIVLIVVILVNLEADQAVQEARFAGACQDQHAGRPAPN